MTQRTTLKQAEQTPASPTKPATVQRAAPPENFGATFAHDFSRVPASTPQGGSPASFLAMPRVQAKQIQREQDRRGEETTRRRSERRDELERSNRGRGSHLDHDWAGRAILERYLTGGGDWRIVDDARWSAYMMANTMLKNECKLQVVEIARRFQNQPAGPPQAINERTHVDIENGEGIVGYQYLHGSNGNVGDFQIIGMAQSEGNGRVRLALTYTWNDVIDPNPQYATDVWKSTFAEVITLGAAEAYNIHISWSSQSVVTFNGSTVTVTGWPGR